jgi:hypothetical protein
LALCLPFMCSVCIPYSLTYIHAPGTSRQATVDSSPADCVHSSMTILILLVILHAAVFSRSINRSGFAAVMPC